IDSTACSRRVMRSSFTTTSRVGRDSPRVGHGALSTSSRTMYASVPKKLRATMTLPGSLIDRCSRKWMRRMRGPYGAARAWVSVACAADRVRVRRRARGGRDGPRPLERLVKRREDVLDTELVQQPGIREHGHRLVEHLRQDDA